MCIFLDFLPIADSKVISSKFLYLQCFIRKIYIVQYFVPCANLLLFGDSEIIDACALGKGAKCKNASQKQLLYTL